VGNTVGSLSEAQRSIIVGSLLGDGTMRCKTNALLEINHSAHQRSYVDWKYRWLLDLVLTPPKFRRGNGNRVAYRFVTSSSPLLTPFYRGFYVYGRKRIPKVGLTPLTMAVWFMDDGCKSRRAVYLNTQQFSLNCQWRLVNMMDDQWGIRATLNRDRIYSRIRLSVEGTKRFSELVAPMILPELRYKLPQMTP
jgi:recombination protein RecA